MKKTLLTGLLASTLALSSLPARAPGMCSTNSIERATKAIEDKQKAQELDNYYAFTDSLVNLGAPRYRTVGGNCSGYVKKSAEDLFGKEYSWTDAWDRRYAEEVHYEFRKRKDIGKIKDFDYSLDKAKLDSLFESGALKRGDILGTFYPDSRNNGRKDMKRRRVEYTHVLNLLGKTKDGDYAFIHEFGPKQEIIKFSEFSKYNFIPMEILKENPQFMADNNKSIQPNNS